MVETPCYTRQKLRDSVDEMRSLAGLLASQVANQEYLTSHGVARAMSGMS
jgi:hypothetical protein